MTILKTSVALAALLAASSAFAQAASAPQAPRVETTPATTFSPVNVAPLKQPATAVRSEEPTRAVNPFTGKATSVEDLQRELELRKLKTALMEEELRNATLAEDLKVLPTRKGVDTAQAETAIAREQATKDALERDRRNAETADAATKAEAVKRKRAEQEQERREKEATKKTTTHKPSAVSEQAVVVQPPQPMQIELVSVTTIGRARSALLSVNGNVISVSNDERTPFGTVVINDGGEVLLGGKSYSIRSATIGRLKVSDTGSLKGTDPVVGTTASTGPRVTLPMSVQPSVVPPPVPGAARATAGVAIPSRPGTPSLQLPPGVQLVPAN